MNKREVGEDCILRRYVSPNVIRVIKSSRKRWVAHAATMDYMINSYKIVVGKPEGKKAFWRPKSR
jgi:hypothetical protein